MPEKPITETIQAKHVFNQAERNTLVDRLTAAMSDEEQIEGELASAKADFKSRLERASLERTSLAGKLRDKFEMRPTLCVVQFDVPTPGRKSYFRAITSENGTVIGDDDFIRDEPMSFDDKQRNLPLEAAPTNEELTASFDPSTPQTKDQPPAGFAFVTDGSSLDGDMCWVPIRERWEVIEQPGTVFDSYDALARRIDAAPPVDESRPEATATTPLGDALHAAAADKTLPLVPVKLTDDFTADRCRSVFRKAAKKIGWPEASIDLLDGEARKAAENAEPGEEVAKVLDVLRAHTASV